MFDSAYSESHFSRSERTSAGNLSGAEMLNDSEDSDYEDNQVPVMNKFTKLKRALFSFAQPSSLALHRARLSSKKIVRIYDAS